MNDDKSEGIGAGGEAGAVAEHPAVARVWGEMDRLLTEAGDKGLRGSEPVTVAWGDLFALIQLVESGTALEARDAADSMPCDRCGHDIGVTAYVPNEVWAMISPSGDRPGMLCLWCMDALAAEQGITFPVPVTFHYEGKALASGNPLKRALAGVIPPQVELDAVDRRAVAAIFEASTRPADPA